MSLSEKCKQCVGYTYQQVIFQKDLVKLKLKIYGIQKKIDGDLAGLGEDVYKKVVYGKGKVITKSINDLIDTVKEQKEEIDSTQELINGLRKEITETSGKLQAAGKYIIDEVKNYFIVTDPQHKMKNNVSGDDAAGNAKEEKTISENSTAKEKNKNAAEPENNEKKEAPKNC